jgi:phosphoribosylformimino-5-aminoimidazole carboxamide ribotide isomerase
VDLFPAVDIRGGRVTHVRAGAASAASAYGDDPAAAVARLAAQGARWVHLVDLDRAYGTGSNRDVVRDVLRGAPIQVQVGGALDAEDATGEMLSWGAARVVIGCAAAANEPALVDRLVRRYGSERLAVGIDARDGMVAPRAGVAVAPIAAHLLVRTVQELGARTVVYTDVSRDGTLAGLDVAGAQRLATPDLDLVVGGGVASLADIDAVRSARLAGAIVGRALHEGRFTLAQALACAAG